MLFTTKLFATCWEKLLQVFGFVYLCLGQVRVGFAASALVCNRLFWPFETLSLDLLGLQRPIGCILGLRQGYCALGSVFHLCCWALLVYPLYFVRNSTSGHCCPSRHFVQGCTNLREPPLVHGKVHEKGRPKLPRAGSRRGWDASCLRAGRKCPRAGQKLPAGGTWAGP